MSPTRLPTCASCGTDTWIVEIPVTGTITVALGPEGIADEWRDLEQSGDLLIRCSDPLRKDDSRKDQEAVERSFRVDDILRDPPEKAGPWAFVSSGGGAPGS